MALVCCPAPNVGVVLAGGLEVPNVGAGVAPKPVGAAADWEAPNPPNAPVKYNAELDHRCSIEWCEQ